MTEFYILAALTVISASFAVLARSTTTAVLFQTQTMMLSGGILIVLKNIYVGFSLFALACASFIVYLLFGLMVSDEKTEKQRTSFREKTVCFAFFTIAAGVLCRFFYAVPQTVFFRGPRSIPFGKVMFSEDLTGVLMTGVIFLTVAAGIGVLLMPTQKDEENTAFPVREGDEK